MTTTIKVHVNGQYRATVTQDDREPVVVEGNYNGGSGEQAFYLAHPANSTFVITEEYVADDDKRMIVTDDPGTTTTDAQPVGKDDNELG